MIQAVQEGDFAYDRFVDLVASCGLELDLPAGFLFKSGVQDKNMAYEGCLVAADGNLEVRLAIRPILGMELEYPDPHSSVPSPSTVTHCWNSPSSTGFLTILLIGKKNSATTLWPNATLVGAPLTA